MICLHDLLSGFSHCISLEDFLHFFGLVLFSQQSLHFAEYGTLGLSLPILRHIRRDFEYDMIKTVYTKFEHV